MYEYTRRRASLMMIVWTGMLMAGPLHAQQGDDTCSAVLDAQQRLDCYDSRFPPAAGADRAIAAPVDTGRRGVQEFGLNKAQVNAARPVEQRDLDPGRIEGVIKSVGRRGDGQRVVTLLNDQAWVMTEPTARGAMAAGDPVVIRKAAMGTFMLVTKGGVALRAKRLR